MTRHSTGGNPQSVCTQNAGLRAAPFVVALFAVFLNVATPASAQNSSKIGNLPHALACANEGVTVIGYLARLNADGSAVYVSPSNIVVEVSPEGVVDNRADGSCAGMTLSELRSSGQAFGFFRETD